jgi:hypothetical protein
VFAAGATTPTASQTFSTSIGAQSAQTGEAVFPTSLATYAQGTYTVRLEAFQASSWTLLDEAQARVFDHCRQQHAVFRLFAENFDLPDLLFCDDFEDWPTPPSLVDSPLLRRPGGSP